MLSSSLAYLSAITLAASLQVCSATLAAAQSGTKFGTYYTDSGGVLELYKKGGSSIEGRLVKIGQPTDDAIRVLGNNSRDGSLKLDFLKDGKVLDTIKYSRGATREPSPFGSQIYTNWSAQETALSSDLNDYGLSSFKSLIVGTADTSFTDFITSMKGAPSTVDVPFDVYVRAQARLSEYFGKAGIAKTPDAATTAHLHEYIAFSSSRSNTAYLGAAASEAKDLKPASLHIQTLGADKVTVFAKREDIVKLVSLGPSGAAAPTNVLPQFLVQDNVGIRIPNPNLIRTYLTDFQLAEADTKRLSSIFQAMGTTFCDKEPAKDGVMLIFCDYFRDAFSSDGDPIWYRTLISIAMTGSNESDFTSFALFLKSAAAANVTKADYERARKQWGHPTRSVADAEAFLLQAFIKAVSREYPRTRR